MGAARGGPPSCGPARGPAGSALPTLPGEWPTEVEGLGEGPGVRVSGDPNTDSPLAGGGQKGDMAQILSSQKKKKMARNRKRESCQLEAGWPCPRSAPAPRRNGSWALKTVVKNPKGKAPTPNEK